MDVFLDLDVARYDGTDEEVASVLLAKLQSIQTSTGKRMKQVTRIPMSYDTPSRAMYEQAQELFCLGYFVSSIIVCRSTAEYLAFEIFFEEVELDGKTETIELVAENLDFRKIVNEFLYNKKKGISIIDKETHQLFNDLYTLGNDWVHPKMHKEKVHIESVALQSVNMLGTLLTALRDVMKDYDVSNGVLVKKATARKKVRPIKLSSG